MNLCLFDMDMVALPIVRSGIADRIKMGCESDWQIPLPLSLHWKQQPDKKHTYTDLQLYYFVTALNENNSNNIVAL